ncbi:MAG: hypothetical protein COA50_13510 [Flavobacteriaceae bacterium]|nr:MAG: hypothetical protein COA50_13510 [Flavobacteriaceae bacterium]
MGLGGPMLAVKYNRSLLKKKKSFKELRKDYITLSGETKLEFKELSEFEKKRIRDKIIVQCKKDRKQGILISAVCLVLSIIVIYGVYWSLLS